ncbi:fungal-specific transcription factor domain-containing protein [Aspergillus bertholletiae]|uniref:Fungal-specific transcription factor domain-containing protein n=1 Tax=Aspergillus bertholletiae TaxID=1226010 RepID=A0A5N7AYN2_9EURO|nr:fungal-specific transcription factor domain-containing protein [Aspergillus bertholletiae]
MRESQMTTAPTDCATFQGCALRYDRARPKKPCTNCSRSNRKCQGYGLRLSWPRPNDRRRAVVSQSALPSPSPPTAGWISDARFVHTSNWDIELYNSLTSSVPVRNLSLIDVPAAWNPYKLEALDQDLLEYFCRVASASLPTFGHDTTALGNILVRITLQGETDAAAAVLQALLAFSSLHRYGLQSQALELKIAALGSLAKGSAAPNLCAKATMQHTATGMMLCSFEGHQSSSTSGQWTSYLGGVKTVLNASCIKTLRQLGSDVAVLLDWVYYHDVLARFSLLHRKKEGAPELPPTPTDLICSQVSELPPPIFSMLNLLSQVCDTVSSGVSPPETGGNVDDYKSFLEVLDWRVRSLPIPKVPDDDDHASDDATLVMQLYQLAILLFLNRSFEGLIDQPIRRQQHIDNAFAILPLLGSCKQQFPIFVIGCEARTDEQRAVVLDVISRTEKMNSSRSLNYCKRILQAVWAQDDLANGNNISYRDKLTSVMSHCQIVPSFV